MLPCCLRAGKRGKKVDGLGFLKASSVRPFLFAFFSPYFFQMPNCYHHDATWHCFIVQYYFCRKSNSFPCLLSALLRQTFTSTWKSLCVVANVVNLLICGSSGRNDVWVRERSCFHYWRDQTPFFLPWSNGCSARPSFISLDQQQPSPGEDGLLKVTRPLTANLQCCSLKYF